MEEPQQQELPAQRPDLGEPSVLDWLKAVLTPWRGAAPEIPPLLSPELDKRQTIAAHSAPPAGATVAALPTSTLAGLPWRALAPVLLALLAQLLLTPPASAVVPALIFFILATGLLVWANLRGEWTLAEVPTSGRRVDPLTVRWTALIAGVALSLIALLAFGNGRFTTFNTLIWLLGLAYFAYALWLPIKPGKSWWHGVKQFLLRPHWDFTINRWTLLLVVAAGLAVFFRFHQLTLVPPEMVSDHAEKLLDVYDVLQGQTSVYFPRNTGREPLQMYLTAAAAQLFNTGVSFLSLKLGTVIAGLVMLVYMYLLGEEVGNRWVGLLALVLTGIAYWPNVLARVALRFILYPALVAPTLYYLLRGIRRSRRNDFILAGVALGIGLHGYTPFRIVPFLVVVAVGLYLLHRQSAGVRKQTIIWLGLLALVSLVVFLPLLRYAIDHPEAFSYRAFSRLGTVERPLPGPAWQIFLANLWDALAMLNWSAGNIWVIGLPNYPALDTVSATFFLLGVVLLLVRFLRRRNWLDLFLLLAVPILMLPSILSLAFPDENPALNRAGGAMVMVFLIVALALEGLLRGLASKIDSPRGTWVAGTVGIVLVLFSSAHNYDLTFKEYQKQYLASAWNTSEMGEVIANFAETVGDRDQAWVVAFPHWADNRLVGIQAGFPTKDYSLLPSELSATLGFPAPKLFLLKPDDSEGLTTLQQLYPNGAASLYAASAEDKDFVIYFVPADLLPAAGGSQQPTP